MNRILGLWHFLTNTHRWEDSGIITMRCYCGAKRTRADWP
jgi:hypothetical protein